MNPKTKWYCWSAIAGLALYVLLAAELYREFHLSTAKNYLTVFFFPLGPAVLLTTAINLKYMAPQLKKYNLRLIFGMLAYMLGLFLVNRMPTPSGAYRYLLVLVPVLPLLYVCFTIVRYVADSDEMWRKIYMEAMAFSGIATGFTCISYIFLHDVGAPKLPLEYGFYLMWIYYGVGLFFSRRRYS